MGYIGADRKITVYVETPEGQYTKDMKAYHYGVKYWAFYLGRDSSHAPFNGKFGYTTVVFGNAAYVNSTAEFVNLPNYILGDNNLVLKITQDNVEHDDEKEIDSETEGNYDVEYEDGGDFIIDGVPDYAYGFWSKFLMTSPNRLLEKPEFL